MWRRRRVARQVDVEEVDGQHRAGLGAQELTPAGVGVPHRRRWDPAAAQDPADRRGANGVTSFRVMDPNPADRAHFRLPVGPGLVDTSRPHCRARGRRARAAGCPGRRRRRCSCSTRWASTLPREIGARQWFDLRKRQDRRFPADDADGPARRRLADRLVVSGSDRRRLCRIARRTRRGRGPSRRP
jgi:hypothetical protein